MLKVLAVNGTVPTSNPKYVYLGSGTFQSPTNLAVDASGNVFVADNSLNKVLKIVAVNGSVPGSNAAITPVASGFAGLASIAVESLDNVRARSLL